MGVPALPRPSLGRGVFSFLSSEHNHRHLHKHHGPNAQGRSAIWPAIKRNDTVDDIMMLSAMHTTKSPTLTNMKAPRFAKGFQSNTLACRPGIPKKVEMNPTVGGAEAVCGSVGVGCSVAGVGKVALGLRRRASVGGVE